MSYKHFTFVLLGIAFGAFTMSALQFTFAWTSPWTPPPPDSASQNVAAPINVSATAQAKAGPFTAAGITTTNRLTVSEAGGAYTYITLKDDQSLNGVKYIHADSNVIGFLNGAGNWIEYWDANGTSYQSGSSYQVGTANVKDVWLRDANGGAGRWASQTSEVLPGTQCGAESTYNIAYGVSSFPKFPCNGHNPMYSCPAGYYQAYTTGSNSDNWVMSCIKA